MDSSRSAVAVYCASSTSNQKAFQLATISLGKILSASSRPLVYGGGSKGLMGLISGTVLQGGGEVTGVVPSAMVRAGGEGNKGVSVPSVLDGKEDEVYVVLEEKGRENVNTIIVESMHERKIEMAKRVGGFIGLPGGYGTFEEILEVITWTQLGIHNKPVILLNVLGFYDPLRTLIRSSIQAGFIQPANECLVIFVDGPSNSHPTSSSNPNTPAPTSKIPDEWIKSHEDFDWGTAALGALDAWVRGSSEGQLGVKQFPFKWGKTDDGEEEGGMGGLAGA